LKEGSVADKKTIKDLLTDEIKDLYSAEKQLTKAIPKMAKGSNNPALKEAFTAHLAETLEQVKRLDQAAGLLEIKPTGKKCVGMEGVIREGAEALEEEAEESILDLGLIGAVQPCGTLRNGGVSDGDHPGPADGGDRGSESAEAVASRRTTGGK
jgi:ferritin-like metal-binding protein YciE